MPATKTKPIARPPVALKIESLWNEHKTEFLKLYAKEQSPRIELSDLEKRLVDSTGHQWYGFYKDQPIPIQRHGKAQDFLSLMTIAMTGEDRDGIFKHINDLWNKDFVKNSAGIRYLMLEIEMRGKKIIHEDLIINFLCCLMVRDDENPLIFSQSIHQEKCNQIKAEFELGNHYFFFQLPELKNGLQLWRLTEEELTLSLEDSRNYLRAWPEVLKTILSFAEIINEKKN